MVSEGQKIQVEKLADDKGVSLQAGAKLFFDKVLMVADGDKVEIGKPYLTGKKVGAELVEQKRLPTVITYKYHSKTRYRNKKGHRQPVTWVKILEI